MADKTISVKFEDHSDEVKAELERRIPTLLASIGAEAATYAQKECPVDTGRLHNSIAWATSEDHGGGNDPQRRKPGVADVGGPSNPNSTPSAYKVYIGSNVEYAESVELHDRNYHSGRAHFLRDALSTHENRYKNIIKAFLDS